MKQSDVIEGGEYIATVSGKRVRVKVLRISERYSAFQGRSIWSCTVRNLSTGREIDVRSPRRLTQVFSSSRVESMSNNNRFPSRSVPAPATQTAVQVAATVQAAPAPVSQVMNREAILSALSAQQIDTATALQMLQALDAKPRSLTCKVSEKGAVSVYGLQRMPVTLYMEQWQRLLGFGAEIQAFINSNRAALSVKPQ